MEIGLGISICIQKIAAATGAAFTGLLSALTPARVLTGANDYDTGVNISPDGKFVYLLSGFSSVIRIYSRNLTDGTLTFVSSISCGPSPYWIEFSKLSDFLYVADQNGNIYQYSRNLTTGVLTPLTPSFLSFGSTTYLRKIVVSSDGLNMYGLDVGFNKIVQISINTTTGQLSSLTPSSIAAGSFVEDLCMSDDGKSVYLMSRADSLLYCFDRNITTGLISASSQVSISSATTAYGCYGCTISHDGKNVYVLNQTDKKIVKFDRNTTTGILTLSTNIVLTTAAPFKIYISPDDSSLYTTHQDINISQISRNITNGNISELTPAVAQMTEGKSYYLIVSSDNKNVYVSDNAFIANCAIYQFKRN